MYDVVALGELLIDSTTISTNQAGYPTLAANPGGAPANFLGALNAYGKKTAFLGKVGDDTFGQLLVNTVKQAGGFIIQIMPFIDEKVVDRLEEKLANVKSVTAMLDAGFTPEMILEELLGEFGLEITDTMPTQFYCNCSKERVEKALISVGRRNLNEMVQEGETIEMGCHFCNTKYQFTVEELKSLIKRSK